MKLFDQVYRRRYTRAALLRVGALGGVIAVAAFVAYRLGWLDYRHAWERIDAMRRSRDRASFAALFAFVYTIATALGVPATPLIVAAGALFGAVHGALLSWFAGMLSGAAGYWIARTAARDAVTAWVALFPRADRVVAEARDFKGMVRLRIFPMLPLGLVSFVAGLVRAPFVPYMAATAIGLAPTSVIFTYFAATLVMGQPADRRMVLGVVIAVSVLVAAITLAPRMSRSRS